MITNVNYNFNVEVIADMYTEELSNMSTCNYNNFSYEELRKFERAFFNRLDTNVQVITRNLFNTIKEEYPTSPMINMLQDYGITSNNSHYLPALEQLTQGRKVTIVKISEFGFPYALNTTINNVHISSYAQYSESLSIIHTPKRKRNKHGLRILDHNEIIVYDGWLDIEVDNITKTTIKEDDNVKVTSSKYMSFDKRNITDILQAVPQKPILEIMGKYKD